MEHSFYVLARHNKLVFNCVPGEKEIDYDSRSGVTRIILKNVMYPTNNVTVGEVNEMTT